MDQANANDRSKALSAYLSTLPPKVAAQLLTLLERHKAAGGPTDFPLPKLIEAMREAGLVQVAASRGAERVWSIQRLFFDPYEGLIDVPREGEPHLPHSLPRDVLDALWAWIVEEVAPDEIAALGPDVQAALIAGDLERARDRFQPVKRAIAARITLALETDLKRPSARLLGSAMAVSAAQVLRRLVAADATLPDPAAILPPPQAGELNSAQVSALVMAHRDLSDVNGDAADGLLLWSMARLSKPWLLFRVVQVLVPRVEEEVIATTELGMLFDRFFAECERLQKRFETALKRGTFVDAEIVSDVERFTALTTGLRREGMLERNRGWDKRLRSMLIVSGDALGAISKRSLSLLEAALPLEKVRNSRKLPAQHPRLSPPLDARRVEIAMAHLTLLSGARFTASAAAFGADRDAAFRACADAIEKRRSGYLDQLQDKVFVPEVTEAWARTLIAASEALEGYEAATVFRRRVAALEPRALAA